jgi:hypothetical protein
MIGGTPRADVAADGPTVGCTSTTTSDGFPLYRFAGNEGASVEGCMRGPMAWGMYAQYLMLVGGRSAYERALGGQAEAEALLGRRLPTGFSGPGGVDRIGTAPLPVLFTDLVHANPGPDGMGVEAGTFLLLMVCYDTFVDSAIGYHRLSCQSRPDRKSAGALPSVLPGFLHLIQRLLAHPALRIRHSPSVDGDPTLAGEVRRGGALGLDPGGRPCSIESAVPLWLPLANETDYTFQGVERFIKG